MGKSKVVTVRLPEYIIDILDKSRLSRKEFMIEAILQMHNFERVLQKIDDKFKELTILDAQENSKGKQNKSLNKDDEEYILSSINEFI